VVTDWALSDPFANNATAARMDNTLNVRLTAIEDSLLIEVDLAGESSPGWAASFKRSRRTRFGGHDALRRRVDDNVSFVPEGCS
jgi:hypothetical protein